MKNSMGLAMDKYEKSVKDLEDAEALAKLKDISRSNQAGTHDDQAIIIKQ